MPAKSNFERGRELGLMVKEDHDSGGTYDCRWDLADEAKALSREDFAEFKRGLDSAWED